jgi:hypothetical protein
MLKAYANYLRPKMSAHRNPSCSDIQKMGKQSQRSVRIDARCLADLLARPEELEHFRIGHILLTGCWRRPSAPLVACATMARRYLFVFDSRVLER